MRSQVEMLGLAMHALLALAVIWLIRIRWVQLSKGHKLFIGLASVLATLAVPVCVWRTAEPLRSTNLLVIASYATVLFLGLPGRVRQGRP